MTVTNNTTSQRSWTGRARLWAALNGRTADRVAWSPLIGGYFRSGLSPELARLSGLDLHRLVRAHPIRLCTEPPEGVRRHAREVLESAAGHPNFILSTGDAVAAGTTIEQLRAVAHAVRGVYGGGLTAFVDQGFP